MCLRSYLPRVRPVYIRQKKPDRESIANAKKLQYPFLSPANIQTLRIKKLNSDLYFSDQEVKYISLDIFIDRIGVLAICINQGKLAKELGKKLVKQIFCWRIEKKIEYATLKNV